MTPELSAEAVRLHDRLMLDGDRLLGLQPRREWLESSGRQSCSIAIRTDLPRAPTIPLLDASATPWQPRVDPDNVQRIAERALGMLAFSRAWRAVGTAGPPAGLLRTDSFTTAILDHAGVAHQDFVDLAWRPGELLKFGMRSHPWQDARLKPRPIRFDSTREPERIAFPDELPWIAGFCMPTHLVVTAAGFSDGVTVGHTSGPDGRAIVTIPRDRDIPIVNSAGGYLNRLVRSPVLRKFALPIAETEVLKASIRYEVDWRDAGRDCHFADAQGAQVILREEQEGLATTAADLPTAMGAVFRELVHGRPDTWDSDDHP